MKKISILIIVFALLISIVGCTKNISHNVDSNNQKMTIAVSIIPQETFVKKVAGDLVDVIVTVPPGNSPANYQPTPKQMAMLSDAKVYFSIGVPTEKANILPKLKDFNKDIKQVSLDDKVGAIYPHRHFSSHGGIKDPHIWLSPKRAIVMVEAIRDELVDMDPDNKASYEKNAAEYITKLQEVDTEIGDILSSYENTSFIIYHPAFGYFADDYGLNMVPVESQGKKATNKDLQHIIDTATEKDIKFVFYQQEFDSHQAETIAKEIGGATIQVAPLSPDYIENLRNIANEFKKALK
jgi:zinc transport system substrate-binding protein